jgi:predicted transcriptional regulator
VKIAYVSDGRPPSEVEESLRAVGFAKVKGSSAFEAEVADAQQGMEKLDEMHAALKGKGVIYEPSVRRPTEGGQGQPIGYQERLARWKEAGIDSDELQELLQYDIERFKSRGLEMMRAQLERVALEREREIREAEAREKVEKARERILASAKGEGGKTIQQLIGVTGLDEEVLTQIIDELVKKGKLEAVQSGRRVAFLAP